MKSVFKPPNIPGIVEPIFRESWSLQIPSCALCFGNKEIARITETFKPIIIGQRKNYSRTNLILKVFSFFTCWFFFKTRSARHWGSSIVTDRVRTAWKSFLPLTTLRRLVHLEHTAKAPWKAWSARGGPGIRKTRPAVLALSVTIRIKTEGEEETSYGGSD